ncbi:MAG TPA: hypothetical protein VHM91_06355 [Verrucomicrobiales bacterium]|jgi:hypothetical protein|nr:hypothetical protein [Verrucomicrobiales bacterium]
MILPLIVLFLPGCDKPEEKRPTVSPQTKPADRLKPVGTEASGERRNTVPPETGSPPGPKPPPPPTAQEVEEFEKAVETLTQKAKPLLEKTSAAATLDTATLHLECNQLMARRSRILVALDPSQKADFAKKSFAVMKVKNALLELENQKNPPPSDIPGLDGAAPPSPAPDAPPPAPDAAPAPPQQ